MTQDKVQVGRSPASQGRAGALRAEPASQSQAKPLVPNAVPAATKEIDLEHLDLLYEKTGGKAWEPPALNYPWLQRMIAAGFLRRCTMRCGFEAFDTGITWTDAGHIIMRQRAALPSGDS